MILLMHMYLHLSNRVFRYNIVMFMHIYCLFGSEIKLSQCSLTGVKYYVFVVRLPWYIMIWTHDVIPNLCISSFFVLMSHIYHTHVVFFLTRGEKKGYDKIYVNPKVLFRHNAASSLIKYFTQGYQGSCIQAWEYVNFIEGTYNDNLPMCMGCMLILYGREALILALFCLLSLRGF